MSWHDEKFGPYKRGFRPSVKDADASGPCGRGIHIAKTIETAISYGKFPGKLFSLESDSPVLGEDATKWRVASAQVLREIKKPDWVLSVEDFIASIPRVKFFQPTQPPRKSWKHHKSWAAARDAAGAAARAAAWDAACAAAWAAARDAAGAAARDAAGAAAWDAAWDAAWAAARGAAGAAGLQAEILVCNGLKLDKKHINHAKARWDVWESGYGLLCDVEGVLYTYEQP